jgi:hypothetical protein
MGCDIVAFTFESRSMSKKQKKKTTLSLDFSRLSSADARAISESTVGNIEQDPAPETREPAPPEPEKPKEPFQGMYYPLGR